MRFVLFTDKDRLWHWQLRAANGDVMAMDPGGYCEYHQAVDAVQWVRANAPRSLAYNLLGTLYKGV